MFTAHEAEQTQGHCTITGSDKGLDHSTSTLSHGLAFQRQTRPTSGLQATLMETD